MTIGEGAGVPAGWYPDPVDAARLRRWDGQNWTSDVAAAAPVAPAPEPSLPSEPSVASERSVEPEPSVESEREPVHEPIREPVYDPAPTPEPEPPTVPAHSPGGTSGDLPEWMTLPGLTLPPDLSAIPGLAPPSSLPTPHFDEAATPPRPSFGSPLPTMPPPGQEPEPEPETFPDQSPVAPEETPSVPSAPTLSRRELRNRRDREVAGDARTSSAAKDGAEAPYAPPPTGGQFSAPPPPGIAFTPPPPHVVQPASALAPPPTARRDAAMDAALPVPQFASVPAPAAAPQQSGTMPGNQPASAMQPGSIPIARARPAGFGVPQSRGTSTAGVWVIAVIPAIHFAVVYLVFSVLAQPFVPGLQWGVLAAPVIFALIFAAVDRRQLVGNGHDDAPSAVFAIIPPLYLIVRLVKLGRSSLIPLIVWVVLQVAAVAAVFALMSSVLRAAIGGT